MPTTIQAFCIWDLTPNDSYIEGFDGSSEMRDFFEGDFSFCMESCNRSHD